MRIGAACLVIGLLCAQVHVSGWWLVIKDGGLAVLYLLLLWVTGEVSVNDLRPFALWKAGTR